MIQKLNTAIAKGSMWIFLGTATYKFVFYIIDMVQAFKWSGGQGVQTLFEGLFNLAVDLIILGVVLAVAQKVAGVTETPLTGAYVPQAPVNNYAPQAPVNNYAPQAPQAAAPVAPVAPVAPAPQAPAAPQAAAPAANGVWFCASCGTQNVSGASFCSKCGKPKQ